MYRFRETAWLPPVSSPYLDPGDRFIPTRSLMDISKAQSLLTYKGNKNRKPDEFLTPARAEYRRKLEENLTLDEEGRPFRMLVFRASPKKPKTSVNNLIQDEEDQPVPKIRHIPQTPTQVLDAPGLKDDYYLNLMDWGKTDLLAIALHQKVYLWNGKLKAPKLLLSTEGQYDDPTSVAWSPDGKLLAVGFEQCRTEVWDIESSQLAGIFEGHKNRVGSLSWNHNVLSSGSYDARIINHDIRSDGRRRSKRTYLRGHSKEVCGLKWSCCGRFLASGGNDNLLHIWDSYMSPSSSSSSSKYLHRLSEHKAAVRAIAWCPFRSNLLASGGGTQDKCIKLWNVQAGRCTSSVATNAQVCALEWNRHQRELLSSHGYSMNNLSLWSYPSMSKIADLKGHQNRVLHLAQSPDGSTVVSGAADHTVRFWKLFEPPSPAFSRKHDPESDSPLSLKKMHIR